LENRYGPKYRAAAIRIITSKSRKLATIQPLLSCRCWSVGGAGYIPDGGVGGIGFMDDMG
jgi:hypothetical protein